MAKFLNYEDWLERVPENTEIEVGHEFICRVVLKGKTRMKRSVSITGKNWSRGSDVT